MLGDIPNLVIDDAIDLIEEDRPDEESVTHSSDRF